MQGPSFSGSTPSAVFAMVGVLLCLLAGCVTEPKWQPAPLRVEARIFDEHGRPTSGTAVGAAAAAPRFQVLGLGPRRADPLAVAGLDAGPDSGDRGAQDPQEPSPEEIQRRREADIRNDFGTTVLIHGEFVTKRYFMGGETGSLFAQLITTPGGTEPAAGQVVVLGGEGDRTSPLGAMLGGYTAEIRRLPGFEKVPKVVLQQIAGAGGPFVPSGSGTPVIESTNDLVLVTARPSDLAAFEDALNLFYANIPQVEIDVKVVEFSTSDSLAFGVGQVDTNPTFNNLASSKLVSAITSTFALSPPLGSGNSDRGLLTLGGIHDGWELNAVLEALEVQGKADVLSNPKLVVRNGGTAAISTFTEYPFPNAKLIANTVTSIDVKFRPVGITLGIKPIIAGTDTVILQIHADVSAVTGFVDTQDVPTPIVSTRTAITTVHVPNKMVTIIGGLRARNRFDNESKVPLLGDIPLLGYLFRSTSTQESETNLSFFIRPRILIGPEDALAR